MKRTDNEFIYEGELGAVDEFTKEHNVTNNLEENAIQEVWNSGDQNEPISERHQQNIKNNKKL